MCSWPTVITPGRREPRGEQVEARAAWRRARRRASRRSARSSARSVRRLRARVGVVLGVHEQARQPAEQPAARSRWSSTRGHLDAVREREERPLAPAHHADQLDRRGRSRPARRPGSASCGPCRPCPRRAAAGCGRRGRRAAARAPGARRPAAARAGAGGSRAGRGRGARAAAGGLVGRLGPARRPPSRTRATSGPRRCSRPCSRAGGGGRRRIAGGYSVASPRFATPSRWVPSRSARRPIWSRRFQTSRWSPGSTSSARSRLAAKRSPSSAAGASDLRLVAAATREQEAVTGLRRAGRSPRRAASSRRGAVE